MQKEHIKYLFPRILLLYFISIVMLFVYTDCHNTKKTEGNNNNTGIEAQPEFKNAYVKFLSFQNPDSSWGFTIFINSRPFLHHKKIPVSTATTGFETKKDAEKIADLFVMMIRNGNVTPKLDLKVLDTLGIIIKTVK